MVLRRWLNVRLDLVNSREAVNEQCSSKFNALAWYICSLKHNSCLFITFHLLLVAILASIRSRLQRLGCTKVRCA